MEDNKKGKWLVDFYQNHKIIFNVICISLIIVVLGIVVPFVINITAIGSDFPSKAGNDGWISFWGSYIGGIFGGAGTLIALYISSSLAREHQKENILMTRKIQEENLECIRKERMITINSKEIEYLKDLYETVYGYEKYLRYKLKEVTLNNLNKDIDAIRNISIQNVDILEQYARNMIIKGACIESYIIRDINDKVIENVNNIINYTTKLLLDLHNYDDKKLKELFNDEEGVILKASKLALILNSSIIEEIQRKRKELVF